MTKQCKEQRIVIDLSNGYKLVAEQNTAPGYENEIFIGVVDSEGVWHQDLAIVRNRYSYDEDGSPVWREDLFQVLVYSDKDFDDYTCEFNIGLYREDEEDVEA